MAPPALPRFDLDHVLHHAAGAFEQLREARLLITGGTGFFGRWLLESLRHADEQLQLDLHVTALTRNPEAFLSRAPHLASWKALQLLAGDVRTFEVPGARYSHVVHAATEAAPALSYNAPLEMFGVCTDGTRRALQVAVNSGARRFLLISSGAVYGSQPPHLERMAETFGGGPDPLDPVSAYAEGKRVAEWLGAVFNAGHPLEVVTARAFAFVGPLLPLDAHFAVGNFLRDALQGGPIRVGGDGSPWRSYLYAADLAVWLWRLLVEANAGEAYNVGSDEAVTIRELAAKVAQLAGGLDVAIAGTPQPGPAPRYVPDITKAQHQLGLQVRVPLDEALRRTFAFAGAARKLA